MPGMLYRNGNTDFMHLQGYGFLRPLVDISFATPALQRQCNERSALVAKWGAAPAAALCRSLQELAALDDLGEVAALPHVRLTGDLAGPIVVASSDGVQITVEAIDSDGSRFSELSEVREVVVVGLDVVTDAMRVGRSDG